MDSTEEIYKETVLPHFLDALNSLNSVAEILQTSTDLQQDIPNNVRQLMESSFKSLSEAAQCSQAQESTVSTNVEEWLNMIKDLEDKQKLLKVDQQKLNGQLSGLQQQESLTRDTLQAEKKAVNNANDALNRAHQAREAAQKEFNTGIGLSFVTIVGLIIGPIKIDKAKKAIEAADREASSAAEDMHKWAEEANRHESQLQSLMNDIRLKEQTIEKNRLDIEANELELSRKKARAKYLQEFLIPLRKCTTLLGTVESFNVMEFIENLIGLMSVLNDIIEAVRPLIDKGSEYQLLISTKVLDTIAKLEKAKRRNL